MKKQLFLQDLSGMSKKELIYHIKQDYNFLFDAPAKYNFLIAYESVGDYGCDSNAFFLYEKDGKLFEVHAAHCSCYGFEDQFKPDETSIIALQDRSIKKSVFYCGGYDNNADTNQNLINEYIMNMK